ncbi:unnamed protein product [Effrenium voratum]|uniref:Glutamyl-tRNA reductase n=2 Tax=Effrenium voratum TaxID=2562239 RepID=A0AA36JNR8_9DINO|nr:unnamed protein product [Effrenium voratum]CAJ1408414.1 unnamed protein product [Effrenium voratum]
MTPPGLTFLAPHGAPILVPMPVPAASTATAGLGHNSARIVLSSCALGMCAGVASSSRKRRTARLADVSGSSLAVRELDEPDVGKFVPKMRALQNQAELLRSGELRQVIETMKSLRKSELKGAISEVDELLAALIGAIQGLRDSAQSSGEFREQLAGLDLSEAKPKKDKGRAARKEGVETMMEVHVVGLSHHSAPVEVRQKLAVAEAKWNEYAQDLVLYAKTSNGYVVPEAAVLSTCNRFELYFASPELKKYSAIECVHAFLREQSGLSQEELDPYLFTFTGHDAINHLFEVSSGLDSLVLGEAQILAQVKACHGHCISKADDEEETVPGAGGKIVAKMLNAGIRIGKLVRTRTKIGKGSVSVSSAAVELMISRSMADLRKPASKVQVGIIGAGKMSRLLLLALFSKHPDIKVVLVNRSVEKAEAVLKDDMVKARGGTNATVAGMDSMFDVMKQSDVVFTATGSEVPIIHPKDVEGRELPLMLVDISVPLNVAKGCEDVENVASYSVDDLQKVVQANAQKRAAEVEKARKIIGDEVGKFKVWQASQGAVPYLAALQAMAERIRTTETEKLSNKLQGLHEKERASVDKLTRHIVDQIFRPIYYSMKEDENMEEKKEKIWALKKMFKLEPVYKRGALAQGPESRGQLKP